MRIHLLAVYLCVAVSTSAQTDSSHWRRNEFGLDLTTFFRQFLTWSGSEAPSYYVPAYMLTYRYHFRQWNLRAAIGGDVSREDRPTPYDFGPSTYASEKTAIDLRVGAERFSELGRRWQVYYGLDIRTSRSHTVEDAMYWNGGYSNGVENKVSTMGIAPIMGVRFRVTPRFSLLTEANWALVWSTANTRKYYSAVIEGYDPIPEETTEQSSVNSAFQTPVAVVATFDL
jgi:hypothetical protein